MRNWWVMLIPVGMFVSAFLGLAWSMWWHKRHEDREEEDASER